MTTSMRTIQSVMAARRASGNHAARSFCAMSAASVFLFANMASAQLVEIYTPTTVGPLDTFIVPSSGGPAIPLATAQIHVFNTTLTINGRHTIAGLRLDNNGIVTHSPNTMFDYSGNGSAIVKGMDLAVLNDVEIYAYAKIDVTGAGYPGSTGPGTGTTGGGSCGGAGGGYGGAGAHGNCADRPGGQVYGSASQPIDFGSGGAGYPGISTGGNGGGAVRLIVSGRLYMLGAVISADGGTQLHAAGGAGGSIWIEADHIDGNGLIRANGGAEGTTNSSGGGGGGGRIAITTSACELSALTTITVDGGSGPVNQRGSAGTIVATGTSRPGIREHPQGGLACDGFTFAVSAAGTPPLNYQWRRDGVPIDINTNPSAGTALLTINGDPLWASFDCVVTNECGSATSNAASAGRCSADFNCDLALDFFDYLDFVAAFSANLPNADFNQDAVIDFFDYLDFVQAFSAGC